MILISLSFVCIYWILFSLLVYYGGAQNTFFSAFLPTRAFDLGVRFLGVLCIVAFGWAIRLYGRRYRRDDPHITDSFNLSDCINSPVIITRLSGAIVHINKSFKERSGFLLSDIRDKNIITLFKEKESHATVASLFRQSALGHLPCRCKVSFCSKDGFNVSTQFEVCSCAQEESKKKYLVWSAQEDMPAQARFVFQESEREYEKIIDNIGIGISLISAQGKRLYVNKQMQQWFSFSDTSRQSICHDIFSGCLPEMCDHCPTCQTLSAGDVRTALMKTTRDSNEVIYKVVAFPIKNNEGEPIAAIEMVEDYTKINKQEEQIRRNYLVQAVMNSLLRFSLESVSLDGFLDCALNIILSTPWFSDASKGAVYLVESDPDVMMLRVQNNLSADIVSKYTAISFGQRACGCAAKEAVLQFSQPQPGGDTYQSYGHYCVPISYANKIAGVMDIYLNADHVRDKQEEDFLNAVVNTLAGVIQRMKSEGRVSKINEGFISLGADPLANIQRLVVLCGDILEAGFVFYSRFNHRDDAFYSSGQYNASPRDFELIKPYEQLCLETASKQKGLFLISESALSLPREQVASSAHNFKTCMGQTAYCAGEPAGVVSVFYTTDAVLAGDDKKLLGIIVSAIGTEEERIRANEQLRQAYDELKKAQYAIVQSEKMAALGRFSSGIAHEVKNPLGIILGGIEFLEQKLAKADKDSLIAAKKIKEATMRADAILRNLLKFASPSDLKTGKLDAKELVNDTITFFRYRASLANLSIVPEFIKEDVFINVDKSLIQQVLFNLLMNSSDAIHDKGQIKIKVYKAGAKELLDSCSSCVIEVADSGEGIPKENLSKLFEPFFTTKRDKKGTGLGLSISKMIVENHGGVLLFESVVGKGTVAKVVLPLAE